MNYDLNYKGGDSHPNLKIAKFWVGAFPPEVLPFRQVNTQGEIVWNYWNSLKLIKILAFQMTDIPNHLLIV